MRSNLKYQIVLFLDASALFAYDHPKLKTFDDLMQEGGERSVQDLEALARDVLPR